MQVFKFGGGIIRDANAIEKLGKILIQNRDDRIFVVLSAMDKTTNKLEKLISEFLHDKAQYYISFQQIKDFHIQVIDELNLTSPELIKLEINVLFDELNSNFNSYQDEEFAFMYDQIVCFGELISSKLISAYLSDQGISNQWIDIRKYLKTSDLFRNADVNEEISKVSINEFLESSSSDLIITQGFIGSTDSGASTTLGREGSDYTAALLGNFTNAARVVFWKDVKGIYNADPKHYDKAILIPELTYLDAMEFTNLGAKLIHHKSISPLDSMSIPLEVRLFELPIQLGSCIHRTAKPIQHIPIIVHRFNKYILKFDSKSGKGLTSKEKKHIVYCILEKQLGINFLATIDSFQYICLNNFPELILKAMVQLSKFYHIELFDQVCMIKVKNGNPEILKQLVIGKDLLISDIQDDIQYIFYN